MIRLESEAEGSDSFPEVTTNRVEYSDSDPLADQISSFVNAVINGSEPIVSGKDGRNALMVALGIIDQIERGCKNFRAL